MSTITIKVCFLFNSFFRSLDLEAPRSAPFIHCHSFTQLASIHSFSFKDAISTYPPFRSRLSERAHRIVEPGHVLQSTHPSLPLTPLTPPN